jgi:Purple acid Phosphatase, N-terminal domain/Calcineurin-like phosphoesterase
MIAGVVALAASAAFGIGSITIAGAQAPATASTISLGVGANASQRIVSWYTTANTAQSVLVAPTSQLVNGEFPASAVTYPATITANAVNGGFNAHAVLDGLQETTAYSYRVGAAGAWSATYEFKTRSFTGDFDFLFFGDPQIGSSGNVPKDGAGWDDTLNVALAANPDTELLESGGDQVETANTETQWNAFFNSDKLRQYPWAATIGNHDVGGHAYDQHFWTPNTDRSAPFYTNANQSAVSGGDYWYTYKGVLFIHLNSNAYANGSDAAHIGYITSVINAQATKPKFTVLLFHHAIYSPADHANDGDNKVRRVDFPTAFSNLGVDLVLAGHDHSYSRSYAIKNGQKANAAEQPGASTVSKGPGGVIYVTGNSASGSKYYDLTTPVPGEYGPDPLDPTGKRHYANSVENQEHVRTYVKVGVKSDRLVIENIRSGTCAAPNAAVELARVPWCGPNSGASPAQPVGSLVDKVTVYKLAAQTDGTVGGSVPATLSLTLGTPAAFGAFTPGIAKDYTANTTANVISTAGDATLSAADPSATATGRLVNGAFSLASPLQVAGTPLPSTIKTYSAPVSNDNVTIDFKQPIAANEPLRTGTYAKTLTFTLSTTTP